jgi:hypothetical protein
MISLLISLLVLAVVVYVANLIVDMLALPQKVKNIVYIVLALIFLLALLGQLGLMPGHNAYLLR